MQRYRAKTISLNMANKTIELESTNKTNHIQKQQHLSRRVPNLWRWSYVIAIHILVRMPLEPSYKAQYQSICFSLYISPSFAVEHWFGLHLFRRISIVGWSRQNSHGEIIINNGPMFSVRSIHAMCNVINKTQCEQIGECRNDRVGINLASTSASSIDWWTKMPNPAIYSLIIDHSVCAP